MLIEILGLSFLLLFSKIKAGIEEGKCSSDGDSPYSNQDFLRLMSGVSEFDESQHFVDMELKSSPKDILEKSRILFQSGGNVPASAEDIGAFVSENFKAVSVESGTLEKTGDISDPEDSIFDETYLDFYNNINNLWEELYVVTPERVKSNPDQNSMIHLPYGYIKAGNSDDLPQLWQSYLIIQGLLENQMYKTIAGIIRNYAHLIELYGHVPYTNRVYATARAQLPLLAIMVEDYLVERKDTELLKKILPTLEKEFKWWLENRTVKVKSGGKDYELFRYYQTSCTPRSEKFREDSKLAEPLKTDEERTRFYSEVQCADESGFKFSSRFTHRTEYTERKLNLDVTNTVPVELNSVLFRYAVILSKFCGLLGETKKQIEYNEKAKTIQKAIKEVLWNDARKMWFDYSLDTDIGIQNYSPTNLMPLYTSAAHEDQELKIQVLDYLIEENIINDEYLYNFKVIPTSNKETGEELDSPYGSLFWNFVVIVCLKELGEKDEVAPTLAVEMANNLIKTIYNEYTLTNSLLESYHSNSGKGYVDKGNKKPNEKSGATIGCVLTLLNVYGKTIEHSTSVPKSDTSTSDEAGTDSGSQDEKLITSHKRKASTSDEEKNQKLAKNVETEPTVDEIGGSLWNWD